MVLQNLLSLTHAQKKLATF